MLGIEKKECSSSEPLTAGGDLSIHGVGACFAAAVGKTRTHSKRLRTAVECRFIEHVQ